MKSNSKILSALFLFILIFLSENCSAQMYWNQSAKFSGIVTTYSYVSVPSSASINLTGSFSAEAWINPSSYSGLSRGIIAKGSTLGTGLKYGVRINTAGRISLITNGAQRLLSKTSAPLNQWTHFSATYNSSSGDFKIYLNGILDTSSNITGAAPTTNSDSLFIGISGGATHYNGEIDELRIWDRELSSTEIAENMRTSLGTSSGVYAGLVLSMPFQNVSSEGTRFSEKDFSGKGNSGNIRNVSAVDLSYRPLHTLSQNNNIELDGDEDYVAVNNTAILNPADIVTLECWVYPRANNQTCNLISKGNQYSLILENGILKAKMNGLTANSNRLIPANVWTKISAQLDGVPQFHINGLFASGAQPFLGLLTTGTDSLYIGGAPGVTGDFNGFMDEVRIFNSFFSDDEIFHMTYTSMDKSNAPLLPTTKICYNLDGNLLDNSDNGGPELIFRNNAKFSSPGTTLNKTISPLNRDSLNTLSNGFYQGEVNSRIPLTAGTSSGVTNYLNIINIDEIINDVDIMITLNHTNLSTLNITLVAPNNDSVRLATGLTSSAADNSLTTLFDDQADSSYATGNYVTLHTTMKAQNNMNSVFSGDRTLGTWRLRINDAAAGDTGVLSMWGIKFNNHPVIANSFSLSNFIQGLYNPVSNNTIRDTITMYLRKVNSPYELVDSCKRGFDIFGISRMSFKNAVADTPYIVNLKHRNSIEIWSATNVRFKYSKSVINFQLSSIVTVYGANEILVDNSPVAFAMYSGDVDQNHFIDLQDVIDISNKANEFATGYIAQDLTGENLVDLNDLIIAYNNSVNFVQRISPLD